MPEGTLAAAGRVLAIGDALSLRVDLSGSLLTMLHSSAYFDFDLLVVSPLAGRLGPDLGMPGGLLGFAGEAPGIGAPLPVMLFGCLSELVIGSLPLRLPARRTPTRRCNPM